MFATESRAPRARPAALFASTAHQLAFGVSELRALGRAAAQAESLAEVRRLIAERAAALEARLALNAATGRALEPTHE